MAVSAHVWGSLNSKLCVWFFSWDRTSGPVHETSTPPGQAFRSGISLQVRCPLSSGVLSGQVPPEYTCSLRIDILIGQMSCQVRCPPQVRLLLRTEVTSGQTSISSGQVPLRSGTPSCWAPLQDRRFLRSGATSGQVPKREDTLSEQVFPQVRCPLMPGSLLSQVPPWAP